jgi:hypothetical protein
MSSQDPGRGFAKSTFGIFVFSVLFFQGVRDTITERAWGEDMGSGHTHGKVSEATSFGLRAGTKGALQHLI